jgi:hypothetical protein
MNPEDRPMSAHRRAYDAARFPRLADFASGYLHQDYALEHVTPERARDAFLDAADSVERDHFAAEAARFLDATADAPWEDVRHAWAALGSAWTPPDRGALERLLTPHAHGPSHGSSRR